MRFFLQSIKLICKYVVKGEKYIAQHGEIHRKKLLNITILNLCQVSGVF